jgi:hypothetical protein
MGKNVYLYQMKKLFILVMVLASLTLTSCMENYSKGERIGVITQFSETGVIFKSFEGHLNVTQTGMNSSVPFNFSIDNDKPDSEVIGLLDSAVQYGWKVKLIYHETHWKNLFRNRGETNHFISRVEVLDRDFGNFKQESKITGRVIDTIYVVIDRVR